MTLTDMKAIETLDPKLKLVLGKQLTTISFESIDYEKVLSKNFARLRDIFPKVKVYKTYSRTVFLTTSVSY
jgi:hypothetical protein